MTCIFEHSRKELELVNNELQKIDNNITFYTTEIAKLQELIEKETNTTYQSRLETILKKENHKLNLWNVIKQNKLIDKTAIECYLCDNMEECKRNKINELKEVSNNSDFITKLTKNYDKVDELYEMSNKYKNELHEKTFLSLLLED